MWRSFDSANEIKIEYSSCCAWTPEWSRKCLQLGWSVTICHYKSCQPITKRDFRTGIVSGMVIRETRVKTGGCTVNSGKIKWSHVTNMMPPLSKFARANETNWFATQVERMPFDLPKCLRISCTFPVEWKIAGLLILACERRLPQNKKSKQLLEMKVNSSEAKILIHFIVVIHSLHP